MQKVRGLGTLQWMCAPIESPAGVAVAPEGAVCLGCGYALVALGKGKCPECGREFDPLNTTSFGPQPIPFARRIVVFVPPWWAVIVYGLITSAVFGLQAAPIGLCSDVGAAIIAMWYGGSLLVMATLSVAILFAWALCRWRGVSGHPRVRWLVLPAILFGWLVAWNGGWIWHSRWYFAKDNFAALAAHPTSTWTTGWYGSYHVTHIHRYPDGTIGLHLGFPDWYSQGPAELQYSPGAPGAPHPFGPGDEDLGNGWFLCWNPT